jgi:hypothetical protein
VTWLSLYSNNVTSLKVEVVDILVVGATCILKSYLIDVGRNIYGVLLKPVGLMEFVATLCCYGFNLVATIAEHASSSHLWIMFLITTTHYV